MAQQVYQFNLKGGGTLDFEGDTPPTDEQIEAAAKENGVELIPNEQAPTPDTQPQPVAQSPAGAIPPQNNAPPDDRGFFRKAWDFANKPLTTFPSEVGRGIGSRIDQPSTNRSPLEANVEGFFAGAAQGAGDVMSNFTTPINLGAMLAGGGAKAAAGAGLPNITAGLTAVDKVASGAQIPEGFANLFGPNSTLGERATGLGEIAMGVSGLASEVPKVKAPVDPNIEWMKPGSLNKNTSMGAAIPPLDPNVAGARPSGRGTTAAADTFNVNQAAKAAAESPSTFNDPFAKFRAAKIGTKFNFKPGEMNRKKMDDYINLGYNYKGMDERGNIIFEKIKDSPQVATPAPAVNTDSKLLQALNLPRTLLASMDFSAPLRQGAGMMLNKEFWTSLDDMFKAWGSEKGYNAIMEDIQSDPMFKKNINAKGEILPSFAEEHGLKLTDLNSMTSREESMMSSWGDVVPGVRRSNRAYTAFLNKLRADAFKHMIEDAKVIGVDGKTNKPLARALAEVINTSTGRGSMPGLERSAKVLSGILFSPRLIASRVQMLNPQYYMKLPGPARIQALRSAAAIASLGATVSAFGKMAGGKIESDPASADFGKIQLGQTRIDPYAGFQQYIVAFQRLMPALEKMGLKVDFGGNFKSTNTKRSYDLSNPGYGQSERADVVERFMVGKANPVLAFAWQLAMRNERKLSGEKMNFHSMNPMENAITQEFIPLLMQDIYSMIKEEGLQPKQAATIPLATFGMGVNTYPKVRPH